MADQEQWQLDGSAPALYQRHLVPAMTAMWAEDLVDRAALVSGQRVLDVACGTGVVARLAAERVGAGGSVDAVDLNAGMLAVARSLPGTGACTTAARSRSRSPAPPSTPSSASSACSSSPTGRSRCARCGASWQRLLRLESADVREISAGH